MDMVLISDFRFQISDLRFEIGTRDEREPLIDANEALMGFRRSTLDVRCWMFDVQRAAGAREW
jgi:hypothetical protein